MCKKIYMCKKKRGMQIFCYEYNIKLLYMQYPSLDVTYKVLDIAPSTEHF